MNLNDFKSLFKDIRLELEMIMFCRWLHIEITFQTTVAFGGG